MDYIKQAVDNLVTQHNTKEPFALATSLGIEVDEWPLHNIKGFVIRQEQRTIMLLNSHLPHWMKRLTLAHELGHFILSPENTGYFFISENTLFEPKVETEANRFMFHLLTYGTSIEPEESLVFYSRRVGVPLEIMRRYYNFD